MSWTKFCSNLIISSCGRLSWNCIYHFPISPWLHYTIFALLLLYITEITGAERRATSNTMAVWTGGRYRGGNQPNQQPDYNVSSDWTTCCGCPAVPWPQLEKSKIHLDRDTEGDYSVTRPRAKGFYWIKITCRKNIFGDIWILYSWKNENISLCTNIPDLVMVMEKLKCELFGSLVYQAEKI